MDSLYQVTEELLINIANVAYIKPGAADTTVFYFRGGLEELFVSVPYSRVKADLGFDND